MISFQTLMQAQGYYTMGYLDLFESLRRISDKPATDIPALYHQMVFNALIGNTDDHLKNFCIKNTLLQKMKLVYKNCAEIAPMKKGDIQSRPKSLID